MLLPETFSFSQNNLQDYVDCPRRFYLRHVLKLEWPAIESEPVLEQEQLMALGQQFHLMVQQSLAGIPTNRIEESTRDINLLDWWHQFTRLQVETLPGQKYCEAFYSIPFANYRLVAKYDLLILQPAENALIYDWKTSRRPPRRATLQMRLQTRIYPFILAKLAATSTIFTGLSADQVRMIYWYPDAALLPQEFQYSQQQFLKDEQYLSGLITEIASTTEEGFIKTPDEKKCAFCRFRTLCERGLTAGNLSDAASSNPDSEDLFDIDFDDLDAANS